MNNSYRYWECECCGLLIASQSKNDINECICPLCEKAKCDHGGKFIEIHIDDFIALSKIKI